MTMEQQEQTLGEEIIEGLSELRDVVESGEPLSKHFAVRTIKRTTEPAVKGPTNVDSGSIV